MFRRLNRVLQIVRSDGVIAGARWLILTSYRRLIPQKQIIWCADLATLAVDEFSIPENLSLQSYNSIEELHENDYNTLTSNCTDLMGSAGGKLIHERFHKGAVLWLVKVDDQLAGYRWAITNNHVTSTYFPHTEADAHSIGIEILPRFRGSHVFRALDEGVKYHCKSKGIRNFYSETFLWNKRAIKAIKKTSSRPIGVATRFNIFGKNVVIWHDMTGKETIY